MKSSFKIGSLSYGSSANFSGLTLATDSFNPVLIESRTFFFPVIYSSFALKNLNR